MYFTEKQYKITNFKTDKEYFNFNTKNDYNHFNSNWSARKKLEIMILRVQSVINKMKPAKSFKDFQKEHMRDR